jgi:uncharacterized protein (TIRG00374 family)
LTSGKSKRIPALRGLLNFIISIGLAAIFLFIAFNGVNLGEVFTLVSQASIFWLVVFTFSTMASHYIRAVRWKVILHSVKPDASMKHIFGALMVGYGVNCVTPKLGEVTRAIMLGKWEGLSRTSMFGTVIVERVIDLVSLAFAVLISAFIWRENLYSIFPWLETSLYLSAFVLLAIILTIYFSVRYKERFYGIIVKLFEKFSSKWAEKLVYIFEMLIQGFTSLKGFNNYLFTILLTVAMLLLYGVSSYLGFLMLGLDKLQPVTYEMAWVLMSISAIGVVIPTPGGTGSYHALAKTTLVLLFGFGETISAAYALLTHAVSYVMFIFTSLIVFVILNRQHINLFKIVKTDLEET